MGVDRVLQAMDSPDFQEKAGLGVSAASGIAATASLWSTLGLLAFLPGMGAGMAGAVATAVVLNAPYALGLTKEARLAALQRAKDAVVVPGFAPVGRNGYTPSTVAAGASRGLDTVVRAAAERAGTGPGPEPRPQRSPRAAGRRAGL